MSCCSLFHVVVDNDDTASKVLEVMLKEKTGRVTFMPLNRLKPKPTPVLNAQDAIPLIDKLRFDPLHQKAFQQVFGRTCVCRDLTLAAAYVKSHGINTITLEGDKVDRKGALTGGYYDVRRSRIDTIKNVATWRVKFEAEDTRMKEVKATMSQLDQEITRVSGESQVLNHQLNQAKQARDSLAAEIVMLRAERERLVEKIEKLEGEVNDLETELAELAMKLQSYNAEFNSPLARGLTDEEVELIESLSKEVETRQKDLAGVSRQKNDVRSF
jgi:structural maintenance of chromosome 3 (chondroitin sulfate proteoglycan 6)